MTIFSVEPDMIAGLLALVMFSADTTVRSAPQPLDTLSLMRPALAATALVVVDTNAVTPPAGGPRLTVAPTDTGTRKRPLVEYSEWYGRRLTIHRTLSWSMLPLFATSYYTGNRLSRDGRAASPTWVRRTHPIAAGAAAAVFGVNTVTGVWNLWAARKDPEGRTRRILHSTLFLLADAGFAYAGSIGDQARDNGAIRNRHRTIALSSMGVSTAGWLVMLLGQ